MNISAIVLIAASLVSSSLATSEPVSVAHVAWLQGCWESVTPQRVIEEQWMSPRGEAMIGMGRTVRNDKMVENEFVVIRREGNQLAYEAHPSGQATAVFLSSRVTNTEVIFENPKHDFPTKIGYQLSGPDQLLAYIEGTSNGATRRIEFKYKRAKCPGN